MLAEKWVPADRLGIGAILRASIRLPAEEMHLAIIRGATWQKASNGLIVAGGWHNAFVNLGLHFILDRIFNINTPNAAISHMGISADTTTVIATTTFIDPAPTTSTNIKALGSGVGATATSRTAETVTCSAGWTQADGDFVITKVGLFNTSTDAGDDTVPTVEGVMNIIGGTGGSSPYNEPFTIDLTNVSAFDLTFSMDITVSAT